MLRSAMRLSWCRPLMVLTSISIFGFAAGGGLCACTSSSGAPSDADAGFDARPPTPLATVARMAIGPTPVAAGVESNLCVYRRLDITTDLMATHLTADLQAGTHHMIVYRSAATVENVVPTPCVSFDGVIDMNASPILFANRAHVDFAFPEGVGITLSDGQMLKIETHYLNSGSAAVDARASVTVEGTPYGAAAARDFQAAGLGLWGTRVFSIAPLSPASTGVHFQSGIAGTRAFAATSHQHRLGTRVRAWGGAEGDLTRSILDDTASFDTPKLWLLDLPLTFDGKNGLSYACDWHNPTANAVTYGDGVSQEMCFVGVYYYPAQPGHGFDVCIDGHCPAR